MLGKGEVQEVVLGRNDAPAHAAQAKAADEIARANRNKMNPATLISSLTYD
jgi:hypothetical protein